MSTGSKLITALDGAWAAIAANHPDVPPAVITTSHRRNKAERTLRGYHCGKTWRVNSYDHAVSEVWIAGERLADGGTEVMCTLLHEAAHALAYARGIKDTSNRARYHNREFVKLAVELGLKPPAASGGPSTGYSDCTITDETAELYAEAISVISDVGAVVLSAPAEEDTEEKARKPRRFATCGCPDIEFPWSKKSQEFVDQFGPVQHQACRQFFQPQEEGED